MEKKTKSVTVAGKEIIFETGEIARQANGSVVVRCGETMVFAAATAATTVPENPEFFPLQIVYQENFSSAGRTLGGFIKRQGRPTQKEILVSRLIDRPLRPMFEEGYFNEVQVLSYVWSYDGINSTEPLAICAASAALTISDIPLIKPIAAVRVGMIDNKFIVNPTVEEQENSILDLILAGTEDAVLMIEGYADFLTEAQVLEAIETGHREIKKICHALIDWRKEIGNEKKRDTLITVPKEAIEAVQKIAADDLKKAVRISKKQEREEALDTIKEKVITTLIPDETQENAPYSLSDVQKALKKVTAHHMRQMILDENIRSDGRTTTDIRPIDIKQSYLPRAHGSSVFTRGETQSVAICTLGGENMAQRFETLQGEDSDRFYLQYFFPPFSVGETGRVGPAGRREVGHGKLAERALTAALPSKEEFPYVIRIESNITESNGSSSMASVCGGCLCMMDAGVPIKRPVSGIAMGLILEEGKYTILSDILGIEDALGDMDFKITGDKEGITAFQMDIKVEGITIEIMRAALEQAKHGRIHILNKMLEVCPTHGEMSQHAPRIETLKIKPSKIAVVIGPGGKQIREIIAKTGVEIDIDDSGLVSIASPNLEGIQKAKDIINGLTAEVEVEATYTGKITSVVPFGVFVEILPGKEGLCHISEYDHQRIEKMEDVAKVGDTITVKVLKINERGQLQLSRRAVLEKAAAE
ncbi:MAG: polyribonucleotide nucleotidyltransferase [Chlamydiales bacterium]|nr:polyribonucleotide nucleotidyltransferase [Chlamydiia bacterium]MCP5508454.1 polyribonucleotide nucleotidyltransferase [Chlamydiales bacterium]